MCRMQRPRDKRELRVEGDIQGAKPFAAGHKQPGVVARRVGICSDFWWGKKCEAGVLLYLVSKLLTN